MISINNHRGRGRTLSYVAAALVACAMMALPSAGAEVVDLDGGELNISGQNTFSTYVGKEFQNGTVNLTAELNGSLASGIYTIGSGAILKPTARWLLSNTNTVRVIDGGKVEFSGSVNACFGYRQGSCSLLLDNGTFIVVGEFQTPYAVPNSATTKAMPNTTRVSAVNNSRIEVGNQIIVGYLGADAITPIALMKPVFAVTNSTVVVKNGFTFASNQNKTVTDADIRGEFGEGSVLQCKQLFVRRYLGDKVHVTFDGTTVKPNGSVTSPFIGQDSNLGTGVKPYTVTGKGLTLDFDINYSESGGYFSSLQGDGSVYKIGSGTITLTKCKGNVQEFTGALVVSNGTWSSSVGYAASAFRADGGNLTLSGALSAANVELAATKGCMLTLAGATITDDSPALTLAGGGKTDYFTRDGTVQSYSLDSLALGPGAVIDLDGDATAVDSIDAATTSITATSADKATVNINFSSAPAAGATFALFAADSADKFTIVPMLGSLELPHEVSISNGKLTLAITAEDYAWKGSQTNWGAANAWTVGGVDSTWADGNNAVFSAPGSEAVLASAATAYEVRFEADATISGASALSATRIDVAQDVTATVSTPIAGAVEKAGAGTLAISQSRAGKSTTVSEGTLVMTGGIAVGSLTLGTDPMKPVVLDYGGQTLSGAWTDYLTPGMDITLTNGTFSTTQNPGWTVTTFPKSLTIAKGATMTSSQRLTWNMSGVPGEDVTNTLNIVGGSLISTFNNGYQYNWIMQDSRSGTLVLNVSDGGLLQFATKVFMLPCRDKSTASDTPHMFMRFSDSAFRVANNHSLLLGYDSDGSKKNPLDPILELSMTNSTLDVGTGSIYLGHNVRQSNIGGHHTAEFVNTVVTSKNFFVYADRPLNAARFDGARRVASANSESFMEAQDDAEGIVVVAGGLTLDTQGFNCGVQADIGGTGAVTKMGSGKLTIMKSQTATGDFVCEQGETVLEAGLSMGRPVTVKSGATFTASGAAQSTIGTLALEAGSALNVASYEGNTLLEVTSGLVLPTEGTASLTLDGGAFTTGRFAIFEKEGIAVSDVQDKLVPVVDGGLSLNWSVSGDTLFLTVGTPAHARWRASAPSGGKMSVAANWEDETVPSAGEDLDFSSVSSATTVEADIDVQFGAVTMGQGVVTFTGSLTATSFSDTLRIAVDANSTVTVMDDLRFTNKTATTIVYSAAAGGRFVVMGEIELTSSATAEIRPFAVPSDGVIVSTGLVANEGGNDHWVFRLSRDAADTSNWIVGTNGLSGTRYFWLNAYTNPRASIQPFDTDFDIATTIGVRDGATLTLNTTGDDGLAHVITIGNGTNTSPNKGGIVREGNVRIAGSGRVVCCYDAAVLAGTSTRANKFYVQDAATLALTPGANLGTGLVTIQSNTTLEVAESGTVNLGGNLTLGNNACLGFNFTERATEPVLNLTDKTVTFDEGETTNVVVKVSTANGVRPASGTYVVTSGGKFADATLSLASDTPKWVKVSVEGGDIVLGVKPSGTLIIVR